MANKDNENIYSNNGEVIEDNYKGSKNTKRQDIEKYLAAAYDWRFNIIKSKSEYRKKPLKGAEYTPMDSYALKSFVRELDAAGYTTSRDMVKDITESSFSPKINPVKDYFLNLFPWDEETDYIEELANTVKCKNSEFWSIYLKKWLVAVVANVLNDKECKNHTMLVLTGGQGKFKTTWINNLCPKSLLPYLYVGKPDIENERKMNQLIAEFFLINLDDTLKEINKKNENIIKNYITTPFVTYDKKFDPYINSYPHLASFIGSVNGNDFLNDSSGSRRFLPFEVENIEINVAQKLDMDLLWSQAFNLYNTGLRYWFNDAEVEELNKRNKEFETVSSEEELLIYYFSSIAPQGTYNSLIHLPPAVLLSELQSKVPRTNLSGKKLGEALNKLGFKKMQKGSSKTSGWLVYRKTNEEIERHSQI